MPSDDDHDNSQRRRALIRGLAPVIFTVFSQTSDPPPFLLNPATSMILFNSYGHSVTRQSMVQYEQQLSDRQNELLTLLLTVVIPSLCCPPEAPPILDPTFQQLLYYYVQENRADQARIEALINGYGTPHPAQDGNRITREWLSTLSNEDCRYRFRCVCCKFQ